MSKETDRIGELELVEIREYQDEKLSSLDDFRENSISGPQYVGIETYKLTINDFVQNPASYTYDDVINNYKHYKKLVTLNCVEGWSVNILWEGMLVRDLLEKAEPMPEAKVIIFHAYDGYTMSFPIDYMVNRDMLMAYKIHNSLEIPFTILLALHFCLPFIFKWKRGEGAHK